MPRKTRWPPGSIESYLFFEPQPGEELMPRTEAAAWDRHWRRFVKKMAKQGKVYFRTTPTSRAEIPEGCVLVHSWQCPVRSELRGAQVHVVVNFHAWHQAAVNLDRWDQLPDEDLLVECRCGWAPRAGTHYRLGTRVTITK